MATLYTLKSVKDQITELEKLTGLSFQRSYLIYKVPPGQLRGQHRHQNNHSILFCLTGTVTVFVQSAGCDAFYHLNNPNQALHLIPSDWRLLYDFSPDCIVLALASDLYSRLDYISEPYRPVLLPDKESVLN
ncbi:hypothetical protein GCM10028803_02240 [Larkinella knui]|uniref:Sugar 3,4-ketoisomerase QdtA cupin domain-containing protein n=1 Tax=Larkinella knui TaxID=2025310 RepID=A0A3P1CLW9_9BACT|nr:FdtA/QdtA family cupin domain-containing protein [Larkinella knui]RRB14076.1 hypothetical protein EHT87_17700 [Larkinella knui]